MKKIISILILSLFIYNTIGFLAVHPFLSIYYKYLGMERVEKPSEEELIKLLVLNKEDILNGKIDFRWIKSREFKYNGDMFDVVKKEETDLQLIIYCINDTKEKVLENEFNNKFEDNLANKKQKSDDNNPFKTIISEAVCFTISKSMDVNKLAYGLNYFPNYISCWEEIPSPPPKNHS